MSKNINVQKFGNFQTIWNIIFINFGFKKTGTGQMKNSYGGECMGLTHKFVYLYFCSIFAALFLPAFHFQSANIGKDEKR